jgi:ubiquinone biosynthesis protein
MAKAGDSKRGAADASDDLDEGDEAAQAGWLSTGWVAPAMRMQRMTLVLARHGFGELFSRGQLGETSAARLAQRAARVLADLGPTFIKLGQLLATREDLFPPEVTRALGELHASVPPMKPRTVERQLRRALGDEYERVFESFHHVPLAAASIGQVHRARLRNGRDVVVKVQRPGLREMVSADLSLMRWAASLLSSTIPEIAELDPVSLLAAFERSLTAELDFTREAENAVRMNELLAGAPEVRVPRIYRQLTRPTVLVMEEVHGRRLGDLPEAEKQAARARLVRAFCRQILDHGVFHADPHPGNVLVEKSGRLVLIDLGAVDSVDATLRANLGRLVTAVALKRKKALTEAVLALSPTGSSPTIDRPRLERELDELIAGATGQADGARVLTQMVALGRTHKLRMAPSLLALVRAMAILDGVVRGLDPARNLVKDLRREVLLSLVRRTRDWWKRLFGWGTKGPRLWKAPSSPAGLLASSLVSVIPPQPPPGSSPPPSI